MKKNKELILKIIVYCFAIMFALLFFTYVKNHGSYLFFDDSLRNVFFYFDEFISVHFIALFLIQTLLIMINKRNSIERIIVNMYGPIVVFITSFYHQSYQNLFKESRRIFIFGNYLVRGIPIILVWVLLLYTIITILLLGKKPKLHISLFAVIILLSYFITFDFLTRI